MRASLRAIGGVANLDAASAECEVAAMSRLALLLLIAGCKNPCVDMCQQIDAWLKECGTSWEAEYSEDGWKSVDDCYDAHDGARKTDEKQCTRSAKRFEDKACY
jgi:hypothetical protein